MNGSKKNTWHKTQSYHFSTDYNLDKISNVVLFLMSKNAVLEQYIISLIKKDIENNLPDLDLNICGKIVLKEMGYFVEKNKREEDVLSKIEEHISRFKEESILRQVHFKDLKVESNVQQNVEEDLNQQGENQEDLNEQIEREEIVRNTEDDKFLASILQ